MPVSSSDVPGLNKIKDKAMDFSAMQPDLANTHRAKCVWSSFLPAIYKSAQSMKNPIIVVAADQPNIPLSKHIPYTVKLLEPPQECFQGAGRKALCQRYALATIFALARTEVVYGSEW